MSGLRAMILATALLFSTGAASADSQSCFDKPCHPGQTVVVDGPSILVCDTQADWNAMLSAPEGSNTLQKSGAC